MVNGGAEIQPDKNWTKVSNSILELLAATNLTARELRCLLFLLRMTYGYQCKESAISLNDWKEGTKLQRPHVIATLQILTGRRIVIKQETGVRSAPIWAFNKYFEQWLPSTPKGTSFDGIHKGTTDSTHVGTMPSTPLGAKGSTPSLSIRSPIKERKEIEERKGEESAPARTGYFGMPVRKGKAKRDADGYIQQAAAHGVDASTFVAMVDLLIDAAKWRSLVDDLGQDDKLNFAKEDAINLIILGNTTPEHVTLLIEAYRKANSWRGEVAPLPRQLTEYAGQLRDGLPQQSSHANNNGRGTSKVDRSMASGYELVNMLKEREGL